MHYCLSMEREKLQRYCIYDDMIITMDDTTEIAKLYKQLATEFEMKNLGELKHFLGIEVARSKQDIFQSQYQYIYIYIYILDLLCDVGMLDYKPTNTLIIQNHKLGEYQSQIPTNKRRY